MKKLCLFRLFISSFIIDHVYCQHYGLLHAESTEDSTKQGTYCMTYNPQFMPVPEELKDAVKYALADLTPQMLCEDEPDPPDLKEKAVGVSRGNCTFSEKAVLVQKYGGSAVIVVSKTELSEPVANQTSDYDEVNITVAMVADKDYDKIKGLGKSVSVQMTAPEAPRADYNLIVIWVMAVGTLAVGSYWSGAVKHAQWKRKWQRAHVTPGGDSAAEKEQKIEEEEEDDIETLDISPKLIIFFVVLMCGMLVSLYFLYDYLVYVIIGLFALASSTALYSLLKLPMLRLPLPETRIPPNKIPLVSKRPEIRRIVLALMCLGVGVWWAVERNADYAWVLQDILGIVFCIHMMKTIRLPSLKACTVLLVLLFVYDIFFVFITPLFTQSGESVMVKVATGGGSSSGEMLPMVLKVPRLAQNMMSLCHLPFSLLGFGDILVPGLLVSYCHGFDLRVQSSKIYFIATVIAYGVGMLATFLALALMDQGQPALLYLVPCTLITTYLIAWRRGELKFMWRGDLEKFPVVNNSTNGTESTTDGTTVTPAPAAEGVNPRLSRAEVMADSDSGSSSGNENRLLINKGH